MLPMRLITNRQRILEVGVEEAATVAAAAAEVAVQEAAAVMEAVADSNQEGIPLLTTT
jgi:putative ubiquitin-RnfH superfamily antitoxin RatB of RatAB toxin-antitoxin module